MADALFGQNYVDRPQTGLAVRRIQRDARFVATRMVPRLIVNKPSGLYPAVFMGDLNRDDMDVRGPSGSAAKAGWRTIMQRFDTDARALEYEANDAQTAAADVEQNPEILIPTVLAYKALIHMERRMSNAYFSVDGGGASTAWYRTVTGANADSGAEGTTAMNRLYMDNANADVVEAFTEEAKILSKLTGADPMDMGLTLGATLWHKIRNSAKIKSQIVGLAGSAIGNAVIAMARPAELPEFARLLGIGFCAVSSAIFNSALKTNNAATEVATNDYIVPENDALLYVNPYAGQDNGDAGITPQNDRPAAFARCCWNGVASAEGLQIRRFRDERAGAGGSWVCVIDVYQGYVIVTKECGTLFHGMVTP
jgi:hypothetical protein